MPQNNKDTYNWGIIGLGNIANKFANDLVLIPNANLYGVASRSIIKAKEFANKYNVPNYYDSYNELVENKNIDIVYIATPHSFHFSNTMMALNKKKGVLCEKPICINSNQLTLLSKKALENNIFLMEAKWTRFLPSFNKVLELIASGTIGKVKAVKADFGYSFPYDESHRLYNPRLGGGSLLDIGIYPVFLALVILGIPDKILACANKTNLGVDSTCNIIL